MNPVKYAKFIALEPLTLSMRRSLVLNTLIVIRGDKMGRPRGGLDRIWETPCDMRVSLASPLLTITGMIGDVSISIEMSSIVQRLSIVCESWEEGWGKPDPPPPPQLKN